MEKIAYKDLLDAGVHFGHLTRKWNPKMAPYIFMEKNDIHIIDLNKTLTLLEEACNAMKQIVRSGKKVMFVATKKQAQELVSEEATRLKMPFVTERWLGGMLTNFATVRKSLKKLSSLEKMMKEDTFKSITKKEQLTLSRDRNKLNKILGGITELSRVPSALFVIDVVKEHIAIAEAKKLGIPVFAMVDTNANPDLVDFPIPANDDAFKSIAIITKAIGQAIDEGMSERKKERDDQRLAEEETSKREADMQKATEE
ncbi:MAG: 30S ribosomal protein S2 [Cytophagales bacterium]|nr:MAG: 30S ribosomal protein S2 [Cytophagales bacterium]